MSLFTLNLVLKLTVGNAKWKAEKSKDETCLFYSPCSGYKLKGGLPEILLEGTIQGGSIKIISDISFICSFVSFGYFITLPCIDPGETISFKFIRLCHRIPTIDTLLRRWFSFSTMQGAKL